MLVMCQWSLRRYYFHNRRFHWQRNRQLSGTLQTFVRFVSLQLFHWSQSFLQLLIKDLNRVLLESLVVNRALKVEASE